MEEQSEVARLREQIEAEYESGRQAMYGLALGTARHEFITLRMENMARRIQELRAAVGEEEAMRLMIAWQDQAASDPQSLFSEKIISTNDSATA
jgi:predicted nuclease with TOPRIM domain